MKKPPKPESYEARRFGLILAALLTLLAALSWWKHHPTRAAVLVSVAVVAFMLATLVRPVWVRFYRLWMKVVLGISWVTTRLLLGILYYGFMTPYGLLAKAVRKDPLDLSWKRRRSSYWVDKTPDEGGIERYEKPY